MIDWLSYEAVGLNRWIDHICYGNGVFVAVYEANTISDGNRIWYSTDLQNWNYTTVSGDDFRTVFYGGNSFYAIAWNTVLKSDDGVTWTNITSNFDRTNLYWFSAGSFNNGLFCLVGFGASGLVSYTSSDGDSWTRTDGTGNSFNPGRSISWNSLNGFVVAAAYNTSTVPSIALSSDGINWTYKNIPVQQDAQTTQVHEISSNENVIIVTGVNIGGNNYKFRSIDSGDTFDIILDDGANFGCSSANGKVFIHSNYIYSPTTFGNIFSTIDGTDFVTHEIIDNYYIASVTYGNGMYVGVGWPNASPYTPIVLIGYETSDDPDPDSGVEYDRTVTVETDDFAFDHETGKFTSHFSGNILGLIFLLLTMKRRSIATANGIPVFPGDWFLKPDRGHNLYEIKTMSPDVLKRVQNSIELALNPAKKYIKELVVTPDYSLENRNRINTKIDIIENDGNHLDYTFFIEVV